ncbi:MAG: metalloregulator ArsR/SmtB family transcription factor [Candidatus Omnitrophica bacterium]|nr:metalloregulator ArsR/SmtB family transcription factor [Candidatus Omnitrophota bacterium]
MTAGRVVARPVKRSLSQREAAELFKALGDETRLRILRILFEHERCVSDLMVQLKLAQSHVSHHLKILKTAGLIRSRREGHRICYALLPDVRQELSNAKEEALDLGCCEVRFKA